MPALAVATNQAVLTTRPVITTTEAVPTQTLLANCVASETTLSDGSVLVTSVYVTLGGNSTSTSISGSSSSSSNGPIIGGVIGGMVALLILISVIWVLWRRNRKMAKQIKENEEEEKRNGIINVEELLPSPYVQVCHDYDVVFTEFILLQYPPSFSPTPQGHLGYPPSTADAYRLSATSPISSSHSPVSHSFGEQISGGAAVAATTQYTPTHSRDGSFSTQPLGRPPSTALTGADQRPVTPGAASAPMEGPSTGPSPAASAKAREAFQNSRRSALYAQNAGEEEGEEDIIMPSSATVVRSTVPPSAWGVPPPAYTPDN